MGTAILSGVLESCSKTQSEGETPRFTKFIATVSSASSKSRLEEKFSKSTLPVTVTDENLEAAAEADVILLAFKPYMLSILADNNFHAAFKDKLILSVLVGTPQTKIINAISSSIDNRNLCIYRAMPNIAASYGQSMTVIETLPTSEDSSISQENASLTDWIFSTIGPIQHVPPHLYDVGGVLAGASAAFLSIAIDGMLDGAVSQGMKRADAKSILSQSLISLATLLKEGGHPAVLRETFSSPSGTTIKGLKALEEEGVRWGYLRAVEEATGRSKEIAGEASK